MDLDIKVKRELAQFIEKLKTDIKEISLNDITLLKRFIQKYIKEHLKDISLQVAFYIEFINALEELERQLCHGLRPSKTAVDTALNYAEDVLENILSIERAKLEEIERLSKPNPYENYF